MSQKSLLISTILSALLFSVLTLAQDPVQDIDKNIHPNLAAAQSNVVEANKYVSIAQKDNREDMQGHAEKARDLLVQVNRELKLAAEAANAANAAAANGANAAAASQKKMPLTVSPPQGVNFSNFTGEVFADTQSEELVNQQVGAGWLRNKNATWPNVSGASCGKFNWAGSRDGNPEQDILYAHSHGQEYLLNLAYTAPCAWSAACKKIPGAQCEYYAPGKLTDWTDYVSAAVAHYSAPPFNVKYFQIWNEPGAPRNLTWHVTDGGDPGQEFVDQIYNPAAAIIHSHGGQVVFSGWACDIGNSNWRKCEQDLNAWLNYHRAWSNTDYIDLHYAPLYVWQELYPTWVTNGKVKGLWQTEIGGDFSRGPLPGDLPLVYLTAMYWALSSGGWNERNPDRYKVFWYPGIAGGGVAALTTRPAGARLSVLKPRGTYHVVLHELFGGGTLAAYSNYKGNLPSYPAASGSVGFTVDQHQIVIAVFPTNVNQPMNISLPLSTPARSVTFITASGDPVQNFRYTQDRGVLNATGNSGSSLSLAYLLSIKY